MVTHEIVEKDNLKVNGDKSDFRINLNNEEKLWKSTIDIYSNKYRFLTEIVSNAYDATVERAESLGEDKDTFLMNNPIVVRINKDNNGEYIEILESHGIGISKQRLNEVYLELNKTTKDKSVSQLGKFGMGRFSCLVYNSYFSITTRVDGLKSSYIISRYQNIEDELGNITKVTKPSCNIVYEDLPTDEKNGTSFKIYLKENYSFDIIKEIKKQLLFFKNIYFDIPSNILHDNLNEYKIIHDEAGFCYIDNFKPYGNDCFILLDQVPYPIDQRQINVSLLPYPIAIKFNSSDLLINPSRENIQYNKIAKYYDKDGNFVANPDKSKISDYELKVVDVADIIEEKIIKCSEHIDKYFKDEIENDDFIDRMSSAISTKYIYYKKSSSIVKIKTHDKLVNIENHYIPSHRLTTTLNDIENNFKNIRRIYKFSRSESLPFYNLYKIRKKNKDSYLNVLKDTSLKEYVREGIFNGEYSSDCFSCINEIYEKYVEEDYIFPFEFNYKGTRFSYEDCDKLINYYNTILRSRKNLELNITLSRENFRLSVFICRSALNDYSREYIRLFIEGYNYNRKLIIDKINNQLSDFYINHCTPLSEIESKIEKPEYYNKRKSNSKDLNKEIKYTEISFVGRNSRESNNISYFKDSKIRKFICIIDKISSQEEEDIAKFFNYCDWSVIRITKSNYKLIEDLDNVYEINDLISNFKSYSEFYNSFLLKLLEKENLFFALSYLLADIESFKNNFPVLYSLMDNLGVSQKLANYGHIANVSQILPNGENSFIVFSKYNHLVELAKKDPLYIDIVKELNRLKDLDSTSLSFYNNDKMLYDYNNYRNIGNLIKYEFQFKNLNNG